jgi:hypothetical protein
MLSSKAISDELASEKRAWSILLISNTASSAASLQLQSQFAELRGNFVVCGPE